MDYIAAANALRSRVADNFTALPIRWQNDERGAPLKDAPNGFVFAEVFETDERAVALGNSPEYRREFGRLNVFVYVPKGTRVGYAEQIATQIRALFTTVAVAGVVITSRRILGGTDAEVQGEVTGRFFCVPIEIDWYADNLES